MSQFLQFLTRLFLMFLLTIKLRCGSLPKLALSFTNHQDLCVGILNEIGFKWHPAIICKFLPNPTP